MKNEKNTGNLIVKSIDNLCVIFHKKFKPQYNYWNIKEGRKPNTNYT